MTVLTAYHRRTVAMSGEPMEVGAALVRRLGPPVVLYERDGEWSVGAGAAAELVVRADGVHVRARGTSEVLPLDGDPLDVVRAWLDGLGIEGWRAYGWLSFEMSAHLPGTRVADAATPAGAHAGPLAHLIVPAREARLAEHSAELRALREGDLDELEAALRDVTPLRPSSVRSLDDTDLADPEYRDLVARAVSDIRAGLLEKVILSRRVPVDIPVDLPSTYLAGRRQNTPARSFLLDLDGRRAAGFSPETVVQVDADGEVSTQPLAGTRAKLGDASADAALREDLLTDAKEIVEHAISVRLAQEEVRELCDDDSVAVQDFMNVLERGSVQHLASRVAGHLAPGRDAWHALAVLFPAITASGIPKAEACDWIRRHEPLRGLYSGAVVIADADGSLDAALVLRSIFQHDGRTWLRAGAGVIESSDPDREFEETCEKLRSVSRFLVAAEVPLNADTPGGTADGRP